MGLFVNDSARGLIASLAMAGTLLLAGCLEKDKDPAASPDTTSANYYAAALGNVAVQIQNAVTRQADWFEDQSAAGELDLAALGIQLSAFTSPVKSSICFVGAGSEVLQFTWLDSRDGTGKFGVKGTGAASGRLIAALRERLGSEQLGTYVGTAAAIQMLSGQILKIPPSCPNLRVPEGAPVIVYRIARPAPPTTELARTEYRSVPCGPDASGRERRGTMVESRVVRYLPDGTITPAHPDEGWMTENVGQCIDDVTVELSNRALDVGGASAQLNNFADIALRALLEQQLAMDCSRTDVISERTVGGQRARKAKSIDTCRRTALDGTAAISETAIGDNADVRNLCPRDTTDTRMLLGVTAGGTLRSAYAGSANVSRTVHSAVLNKAADKEFQRERWVGQDINCSGTDDYTVACGDVPGAPDVPDEPTTGGKWNILELSESDLAAFGSSFGEWFGANFGTGCLGDCESGASVKSGTVHLLDWDWFNSRRQLHESPGTVRAHRELSAHGWLDAEENFIPDWNLLPDGKFGWQIATNACLIKKRELQLACPVTFDSSKEGPWDPYELQPGSDFHTTLMPGGTYSGVEGAVYHKYLAAGHAPGLVTVTMPECNLKGCSDTTRTAGPGLDAYIQSWTNEDVSSINGAPVTAQTIMMNKDGQVLDYTPQILSGPRLEYVGKYTVPLHCGRIERRALNWPAIITFYICRRSGGGAYAHWNCNWEALPGARSITEITTREWVGENARQGTWSKPVVRYTSPYGTWTRVEDIPNPLLVNGGVVYQ